MRSNLSFILLMTFVLSLTSCGDRDIVQTNEVSSTVGDKYSLTKIVKDQMSSKYDVQFEVRNSTLDWSELDKKDKDYEAYVILRPISEDDYKLRVSAVLTEDGQYKENYFYYRHEEEVLRVMAELFVPPYRGTDVQIDVIGVGTYLNESSKKSVSQWLQDVKSTWTVSLPEFDSIDNILPNITSDIFGEDELVLVVDDRKRKYDITSQGAIETWEWSVDDN